eukprot:3309453-Rhodomonas_salina.2
MLRSARMEHQAARVVFDGKGSAAPAPPSFSLDLYGAATSPLACLKGGGSAVLCRARLDHEREIDLGLEERPLRQQTVLS